MIRAITVGPFQENCYLIVRDGECAIVDPGDEADRIAAEIKATGAVPRLILLTHAHLDHVGAVDALKARWNLPLYAPREELALLAELPLQCAMFGLPPIPPPQVDHIVEPGTDLPLGRGTIEVIATPGHSPGGTSYRIGDDVFVGDTIFAGGVGRTDLWGGSWAALKASIEDRIFTLPDAVTLYPGHGPTTTVGVERRTNPFFN
jgi:glyoxylase-like metal-dependent hydrolase (beta-lactamase superfamily II)